jgi:hypothetical protein
MPRPPHAGLGNQYSDTRAVSKADRAGGKSPYLPTGTGPSSPLVPYRHFRDHNRRLAWPTSGWATTRTEPGDPLLSLGRKNRPFMIGICQGQTGFSSPPVLGGNAVVSVGGGNLIPGLRAGIRSEIKGYYHPSYSVHNAAHRRAEIGRITALPVNTSVLN